MITREKAAEVLNGLANTDILSEEIQNALADIEICIEAELQGWHFWGSSDDEYIKMHTAYRSDLYTDELIKELETIDKQHTFKPAPYEADNIAERYADKSAAAYADNETLMPAT